MPVCVDSHSSSPTPPLLILTPTRQTASAKIVSGALPVVVDLAQSLAALKLHIDDLERGGRPRPRNDNLPSYKPKSVLPPSIVKVASERKRDRER